MAHRDRRKPPRSFLHQCRLKCAADTKPFLNYFFCQMTDYYTTTSAPPHSPASHRNMCTLISCEGMWQVWCCLALVTAAQIKQQWHSGHDKWTQLAGRLPLLSQTNCRVWGQEDISEGWESSGVRGDEMPPLVWNSCPGATVEIYRVQTEGTNKGWAGLIMVEENLQSISKHRAHWARPVKISQWL